METVTKTAAERWAELVERRTGKKLAAYEATRQIDALAEYFRWLMQAKKLEVRR